MATANVSTVEKQNTFLVEQFHCSPDLLHAGTHQLRFISVLNSFLSVTAFLGNALILLAFRKESSLHPPSKHLLRSLTTTDLCVGLIVEPLYVTLLVTVVNEDWNVCHYVAVAYSIASFFFSSVSLFTLTALSVDRLLALLLGLRYQQVVTLKRTFQKLIIFWVIAAVFSAMWFWNPLVTLWYGTIGIPLYLITLIFSYTKIFFTFRHRNTRIQNNFQQPNQTNQLNIARYKKAVSTAVWLQLTLIACYLPDGVASAFVAGGKQSSSVSYAWIYATTLVLSNSSINPILYCWKLEEVRQAVKDTIRQVLCRCFSS